MRAAILLAAALLWQDVRVAPEPKHFAYQRNVDQAGAAAGTRVCAALDGAVYGHGAPELADLRLFAGSAEMPYVVTVSGTATLAGEQARVLNLGLSRGPQAGHVVFDLSMPARPYSSVSLGLSGSDFVGTAKVTGQKAANDTAGTALGTFTVFDLTGQRLGRSTTLALAETSFPFLHVDLAVSGVAGKVAPEVSVTGAEVPPSREAQTVYTVVASTGEVTQAGRESVATFEVAARVPVERVSFSVAGGDRANFSRDVSVTGRAEGDAEDEVLTGTISRVQMKDGEREIKSELLSVPATLGVNAQRAARVRVAVANGDDRPLAIAQVRLEMRERKVCFDAQAGPVTMLYGDDRLKGPVYDYSRTFDAGVTASSAVLGPETANPRYEARVERRSFADKHPELLWVGLLGMVGVLGLVAFRSAKKV